MAESDKTLFEIYRETGYARGFRSIFYTDLEEHARDKEIARAAAGETIVSGYVRDDQKEQARAVVDAIVAELDSLDEEEQPELAPINARLRPFLVP
jgi:hypothetical protein